MPTSFKVKLFKCFLDAAVSEQVARMVAMKAATENAANMIKQLSMSYNRARQTRSPAKSWRSSAASRRSRDNRRIAARMTTRPFHYDHSQSWTFNRQEAAWPSHGQPTNIGHVTQIIGSTFDVEFPEGHLPAIYNAVKINSEHKGVKLNLTGEVQQQLGGSRVRCVALGSTDGMVRGMECVDTGSPVNVPVGKATLGRVFNLLGEPIDGRGPSRPPNTGRSTATRRPDRT